MTVDRRAQNDASSTGCRPCHEVESNDESSTWQGDADSTGALAYYAFKRALGNAPGSPVEPTAGLKDEAILDALHRGAAWLRSGFGSVEVPYGRYFRVGREGGDRSWPVGGGTLKDQGMATPRAISFSPGPDGKSMLGHGGQTSTQVIIMTEIHIRAPNFSLMMLLGI